MKNMKRRRFLGCAVFTLVFVILFTVISIVFYPKWTAGERNQMSSFYREEENTIDVLFLGSCNMYTSFSPLLCYEEYGITSYVMACPDQELSTSYHYLVEALKNQDIKTVVVEALFLTNVPTANREYYNRLALDYMPISLNKMALIGTTVAQEVPHMQSLDSTAPDKVLTYASYIFPLLRYHSRDDISADDLTFFFSDEYISYTKGSVPGYNYSNLDEDVFVPIVNGDSVREVSNEYFLKIQELCAENNIDLVLMKSPNRYRWNEELSAVIQEYADETGVTYIDLGSDEYEFTIDDYGYSTGRLNIHGMKKVTSIIGRFLLENYDLPTYELEGEAKEDWLNCIELLYARADEEGMSIRAGEIGRIHNVYGGIRVMWNDSEGAETYKVFRLAEQDDEYLEITETNELSFTDTAVEEGVLYSYYVVPQQGEMDGEVSEEKSFVYVATPENFTAVNDDGSVHLEWDENENVHSYQLQRRTWNSYSYETWDTTTGEYYNNKSVSSGMLYYYRLRARIEKDGFMYYSASAIDRAIPISAPTIDRVYSDDNGITIGWDSVKNVDGYEIWRSVDAAEGFELHDTVTAKTSYTDSDAESGVEYYYRICAVRGRLDVEASSDFSNMVSAVLDN